MHRARAHRSTHAGVENNEYTRARSTGARKATLAIAHALIVRPRRLAVVNAVLGETVVNKALTVDHATSLEPGQKNPPPEPHNTHLRTSFSPIMRARKHVQQGVGGVEGSLTTATP